MKVICMFLLLLLTGCAGKHWEPLTETQVKRAVAGTILTVIDVGQSVEMVDKGYREQNPVLPEYPSKGEFVMYGGLAVIGCWTITKWLPVEHRWWFQYLWIISEGGTTVGNWSIGLKFPFK